MGASFFKLIFLLVTKFGDFSLIVVTKYVVDLLNTYFYNLIFDELLNILDKIKILVNRVL